MSLKSVRILCISETAKIKDHVFRYSFPYFQFFENTENAIRLWRYLVSRDTIYVYTSALSQRYSLSSAYTSSGKLIITIRT